MHSTHRLSNFFFNVHPADMVSFSFLFHCYLFPLLLLFRAVSVLCIFLSLSIRDKTWHINGQTFYPILPQQLFGNFHSWRLWCDFFSYNMNLYQKPWNAWRKECSSPYSKWDGKQGVRWKVLYKTTQYFYTGRIKKIQIL